MLNVDQYSFIRTAHRVYGKKIKQIARETGHSKNTIKKVLRGEYTGYKPRIEQPYPIVPQVFICSYMCLQFSRVAKTVTTRYY